MESSEMLRSGSRLDPTSNKYLTYESRPIWRPLASTLSITSVLNKLANAMPKLK